MNRQTITEQSDKNYGTFSLGIEEIHIRQWEPQKTSWRQRDLSPNPREDQLTSQTGRRVEREARENFAPWRNARLSWGIVYWGREGTRDEGGVVGKGQIQSLPCLEPFTSIPVNLRKKFMQLNTEEGGQGRGALSSGPSLSFSFHPFPLLCCTVLYLHQLFPLLFPISAKTLLGVLESLLCTAMLACICPQRSISCSMM